MENFNNPNSSFISQTMILKIAKKERALDMFIVWKVFQTIRCLHADILSAKNRLWKYWCSYKQRNNLVVWPKSKTELICNLIFLMSNDTIIFSINGKFLVYKLWNVTKCFLFDLTSKPLNHSKCCLGLLSCYCDMAHLLSDTMLGISIRCSRNQK